MNPPPSIPPTTYTESAPAVPLEKIGANGRIGLIALATDVNSETDLRRMTPAGVEIFTNRVQNCNPLTPENLAKMAPDISRAAAGILPGDDLDALVYSCTSGTAILGEAVVTELLQTGRGALPCTNPLTALIAACDALAARRISILTPYGNAAINRQLVHCLHIRGVQTINLHSLGIASDADMSGLPPAAIDAAARAACDADADALFISCTAVRAVERIAELEAHLQKPVISSNQAMLWHALKLIKRPPPADIAVRGFGRLFAR